MRTKGPRPAGSLRYTSPMGAVEIAYPGSLFYSTLLMLAQERWSDDKRKWVNVLGDDDGTPAR